MPSGKQVLLSTIQKHSQKCKTDKELNKTTDEIQSALALHCSTSGETIKKIEQIGWLSEKRKKEIVKQGLGLLNSEVFLSDLFEELIEKDTIPKRIKKRFPELTQKEYSVGLDIIWYLLSSLQYWEQLSSVENEGKLDKKEAKKLLKAASRLLKNFKKEPW